MRHLLKRHPVPMEAELRDCLVLAYALPAGALTPLLPPGLTVDTYGDLGFLAVAMVRAEGLRPAGWPGALGRTVFLAGYRVFVRLTTAAGRRLRGLRILRSDTDSRLLALAGNRLTHYGYQVCDARVEAAAGRLAVRVTTAGGAADLDVVAHLDEGAELPAGSPFRDLREARRFAGPLPFTFDAEPETGSIVVVEAVRQGWRPRPVRVEVRRNAFLERPPFAGAGPRLAGAFHVAAAPYRWERGRLERPRVEAAP